MFQMTTSNNQHVAKTTSLGRRRPILSQLTTSKTNTGSEIPFKIICLLQGVEKCP